MGAVKKLKLQPKLEDQIDEPEFKDGDDDDNGDTSVFLSLTVSDKLNGYHLIVELEDETQEYVFQNTKEQVQDLFNKIAEYIYSPEEID